MLLVLPQLVTLRLNWSIGQGDCKIFAPDTHLPFNYHDLIQQLFEILFYLCDQIVEIRLDDVVKMIKFGNNIIMLFFV